MSSGSSSGSSSESRRAFLKTGAALGSALGLGTFGLKIPGAHAAEITDIDRYYPERPPVINRGPVFLRKTFSRPRPTGKIPVLQGATSQTETQFRILIKTNHIYRYFVVEGVGGGRREVSPRSRSGVPTSQSAIDHVFVDGLLPDTSYWLEIQTTTSGEATERRQFSTLSARAVQGEPLRVALISCQNDRYVDDQADMWDAVAKAAPELMIFNGDSCYVDQRVNGSVEGMWSRHVTSRRMFDVFKWDRLVPILTTWDDHDAGDNDADSESPYIKVAREYFHGMFASDPVSGYTPSKGLGFSFNTHGMRFVFLDGRSNKNETQVFSQDDERWMENEITSSPGPVWLVNGQQFFGGYLLGAESVEYTSYEQLDRILRMGRRAKVPMVLMSGDVHFSELMELEPELLGYRSYELTSSALYSRTFPGQQFRSYNERRLESTSRYNFMAIEMRAKTPTTVEFETVCMGAYENEFFRLKTEVRR